MKKLFLSFCLVAAFACGAAAQTAPKNEAVEKTSASVSRLMVEAMGLNENEYLMIRNLNLERLSKAAEVARNEDAESREARLREIDEEFENKLFRILSSRQVEAYAEFKAKPEGNFLTLVQEVTPNAKK
ncbi:hypothetical protein [Rufibacter psychrotolerans]|uniref:hypothetical protein n=1 Tax=Rufibacter psychrotolerans TaxID=2812556 RepID=UPI001967C7C4|nr:hypothetical protein [Rufibacter sp. SYSU D00308]